MPPRIHSTPEAAITERIRETVCLEGRTFLLDRPAGLDQVFDHVAVRAAYASDEYIPYWADLWAAARMLAKVVLREPWEKFGKPLTALEIGCGLGLGGIAALARGLHVTFSDCDEGAIRFAAANARLNGFSNFREQAIDLRSPPDLAFPIILGSDVLYEERLVEPTVALIERSLLPGGLALICDPDRLAAKGFAHCLRNAGLPFTSSFVRAGEPGGERIKGTVYRISPR